MPSPSASTVPWAFFWISSPVVGSLVIPKDSSCVHSARYWKEDSPVTHLLNSGSPSAGTFVGPANSSHTLGSGMAPSGISEEAVASPDGASDGSGAASEASFEALAEGTGVSTATGLVTEGISHANTTTSAMITTTATPPRIRNSAFLLWSPGPWLDPPGC